MAVSRVVTSLQSLHQLLKTAALSIAEKANLLLNANEYIHSDMEERRDQTHRPSALLVKEECAQSELLNTPLLE